MSITKLQNGSDIRGVAISTDNSSITLGKKEAEQIGAAFATWYIQNNQASDNPLHIAVGNDPRISGESLKKHLCIGINSTGTHTVDTGLSSTPSMYMATLSSEIDAAIMITASHLPYDRNGFKFFTQKGGLNKEDIKEILTLADKRRFHTSDSKGTHAVINLNSAYYDSLINFIRKNRGTEKPLENFRIIVDAGNGSGGFFTKYVLEKLGADTTGSLFLEPDGMFPNHIPNPEDKEAIKPLCKRVVEMKANLGIMFDTDVDRAALVDSNGKPVARNELIALISAIILEEFPGSWIVTDSITSNGLKTFIEKDLKGYHHRFKRGYRNVINEAIYLNKMGKDCQLAIETSGHAALKENNFLDDGAFLITRILAKASELGPSKSITELIAPLQIPYESKEFRVVINHSDFYSYGVEVIKSLERFSKKVAGWSVVPDNYEGVRIACDKSSGNGWFLLRLSLHDPVLPLNIESETDGGVKVIATKLNTFFRDYTDLDIASISAYLA
jgi:phosphomannomutase